RWDKTKWYTIDYGRLAELVPQTAAAEGPAHDAPVEPLSMASQAATEEAESVAIDGAKSAPSWISTRSSIDYSNEIPKRACEGEPDEEARQPAPDSALPGATDYHFGEKLVNELDAAYAEIPEAERQTWYQRADQALEAAGMPEWMRITPTVKEMALRMWVATTIPAFASG
ncbi:hypothetical protein, partial [Candidatus Entotheonella palauensis]|uniref:hypothetical protein n=1 Tax=Candidatus Entotheonella palauensis TaxID=93172 RepID=UPI001C4E08C6